MLLVLSSFHEGLRIYVVEICSRHVSLDAILYSSRFSEFSEYILTPAMYILFISKFPTCLSPSLAQSLNLAS